jgi:hypothetical protein
MTEPFGERPGSGGGIRMGVAAVTVEVADRAIMPPDMDDVVDQVQRMCGQGAGRVRRARARLFGPDHSGVTFAEAKLILTDGSSLSESGQGQQPAELSMFSPPTSRRSSRHINLVAVHPGTARNDRTSLNREYPRQGRLPLTLRAFGPVEGWPGSGHRDASSASSWSAVRLRRHASRL